MSEKLNQLQEKRAKLAADLKAHVDEATTRAGGNQSSWSAEDAAKFDELNAAYDANYAELETERESVEKAEKIAARLAEIEAHGLRPAYDRRIGRDGADVGDHIPNGERENWSDPRTNAMASAALRAWFLGDNGTHQITDAQREAARRCNVNLRSPILDIRLPSNYAQARRQYLNALSGQDGTDGGFLRGETLVGSLEVNMLAFGGVLQVADVIRTSDGNPLRWPTADDTSNSGYQIGESAAPTSTSQPSFGQKIWYAYKFTSGELLVPYELLRDSSVDLAPLIGAMLGERLGRVLNTKFTTGSGAGTPQGIVTGASLGVTAASATAIAFDELIDLQHAVDIAYRNSPGAGFMLHDSVLKAVRKLKTGTGEYLWTSGTTAGAPDMILGSPYWVNLDMASSIATTAKTVLYGHFPHYKVRQVNAIRLKRLVERHAENDQDAFLAFVEADAGMLNAGTAPVKYLQQA